MPQNLRLVSYLLLLMSLWLIVSACKTAQPAVAAYIPPTEPVILTIGGQKITTDEFFQSFTKNQFSPDTAKKTSLTDYLGLYTNLKLKVLAAQQQGRDTTAAFQEEMASYRKQLAQSYLTDKPLIENLVAEAYQRMKEDLRVSHILVPVASEAAPADTLAAYRAALALRGRIESGESFDEIAKRFSKDPASAEKGGDLGFFTAFQTVYSFESTAYGLAKGAVSMPVRTQSGFHLIKTTERRPSRGKVTVAHVLVSLSPSATDEGKVAAKRKIEEAYGRLEQKEAFEIVCREYSDDATSKSNGGALPQFGTGRMIPAFEEAAFGLAKIGDVSVPVLTNYGWHIIKLLAKTPIESFEELAPTLRQKVVNDSRSALINEALSQKLQKAYKLSEQTYTQELAFNAIDSLLLLKGTWKYSEPLPVSLENKMLFSIDNQVFTVNQFFEYLKNRQEPKPEGTSANEAKRGYYRQFVNKKLTEYEENNLEKKYPEFRILMTEIRDGVLLSQVMETNVWERSLTDSLGQRVLYEKNKEKYRYPDRAVATVVVSNSDSLLKRAQEMLMSSPYQLRRKGTDLLYELNETDLSVKHRETLVDVAIVMSRNENYRVEVSAYSDKNEPDSLSTLRLRSAVKALTNNRISLSRIIEKDYGKFRPVAEANRNRRVSFQYFSTAKKDVEKALNALLMGGLTVSEGTFAKGGNRYVDAATWQAGNQLVSVDGKKAWLEISRIEPARPKTFSEARGTVINDYQRQLEQEWLAKLKQQFPVQVNEAEVKKLVK